MAFLSHTPRSRRTAMASRLARIIRITKAIQVFCGKRTTILSAIETPTRLKTSFAILSIAIHIIMSAA